MSGKISNLSRSHFVESPFDETPFEQSEGAASRNAGAVRAPGSGTADTSRAARVRIGKTMRDRIQAAIGGGRCSPRSNPGRIQ